MLQYIYRQPLILILIVMSAGSLLWAFISGWIHERVWRNLNLILFIISALTIVYITLLDRTPGKYDCILRPFASLTAAKHRSELYRSMLMNIFLFFPAGLSLVYLLPKRWHCSLRILLTVLIGCLLSIAIESSQYYFALGTVETDDVLCNTMGAFIGATSLRIAHTIQNHKKRFLHNHMSLTTTEKQFLLIIKSALAGSAYTNAIENWSAIFSLANEQKLLPILFEAVRKTPAAENNAALFKITKQQVIQQVLNQTVRTAENSDLYHSLRAAGLHPIVVKGELCSRLYPLKDHRIRADDDLLIPDDEFLACHEKLLAYGLKTVTAEDDLTTADEVSYTKTGSPLYIELHRRLFDSSKDAHDDLNHFFSDIHPIEMDGFLTLPPHEHLLYLILHAYKHFVSCGIGLRQFCDIGLWAREYHDKIDWALLHDQCAEVHAATFAAAVFRIAHDYLGILFDLPGIWYEVIDVEPLLHDTFCGGVYGSNDYTRLHSSTVTLNAVKSSRKGEKSSILRSVFPKRVYLETRYSYLKRHPYLLPIAWLQRVAHYASEKKNNTDNSTYGSIKLAKERIELMKMYGIFGSSY